LQAIQATIGDKIPDHGFVPPIMDFNNALNIEYTDILTAMESAKENLWAEIDDAGNDRLASSPIWRKNAS
jgi:hypothetical protein